MDIIALYTENQICVNIDGSKNYNGTNKTKIKYIGYKNNKTAAAYLSANTRYKIKYKGTNELGSLSIRLDTQFPHKLKFNSLTENQEYIVNPSETGMYYLYTESNLDTKIYLYKKENSGYKLLEYVDDIEIDDDNVEYNASLYYEFEKGNEYKIVVTANNQNESANFYIDFYMASTKVFGNVTVNCKSGETYEYYYEASANRIVNAYTEGNVDTALTVYIGQVQIAYNDDSEIDDEIEYNASVYFIAEKNSTYKLVLYAYDDGLANLYIS